MKADDPDIWTAHKCTASPVGDGGKSRIPVLKLTHNGQELSVTTNEDKSSMLANTFFLPRPPENSPIQFIYPKPVCEFDTIFKEQIKAQLAKLKLYKAPGPDGIPNIVLTRCANTISDRLYHIYSAILKLGIYYAQWRILTAVVLHKLRKHHCDTPKAYRLIALLNIMLKVLTAIMADIMTYYTEFYQLLPVHHFSGQPDRTTTDTVHLLLHKIKDSWHKRQVTAVLFFKLT